MLYEIGDPQAYLLPDVVCDFSNFTLRQAGPDRVRVEGAIGRAAPDRYKVSATYGDGFRAGAVWFFYGEEAGGKARSFAETAIARAQHSLRNRNAPDFDETLVEVIGDESHYGAEAGVAGSREVAVKIAARHRDARACAMLLKEITGLGLAAPPGLSGFAGARSRPSPVVRLFSTLVAKETVPLSLVIDGKAIALEAESGTPFDAAAIARPTPPIRGEAEDLVEVPLIELAFARSGDKGNKANIGVLPRQPDYAPWLWAALTEAEVARRFAHFLKGGVQRWYLPGTGAINFLLDDVLGGGGIASLRNDPQAKGYSQILLQTPIPVPRALVPAT
jgi:hypothetical protein